MQHPTAGKVTVTVQVEDQGARSITLEDALKEPPPRFSFTVRTHAGYVPHDTDLQVLIQQIVEHQSNGADRSLGVRVEAEWERMSDPRFGVCSAANAEGKKCIVQSANPAACGLSVQLSAGGAYVVSIGMSPATRMTFVAGVTCRREAGAADQVQPQLPERGQARQDRLQEERRQEEQRLKQQQQQELGTQAEEGREKERRHEEEQKQEQRAPVSQRGKLQVQQQQQQVPPATGRRKRKGRGRERQISESERVKDGRSAQVPEATTKRDAWTRSRQAILKQGVAVRTGDEEDGGEVWVSPRRSLNAPDDRYRPSRTFGREVFPRSSFEALQDETTSDGEASDTVMARGDAGGDVASKRGDPTHVE